MNWFSWLFIGTSIVAVLFIGWFLISKGKIVIGDPLDIKRNMFWLFILLVLTPTLGIAIGLMTVTESGVP